MSKVTFGNCLVNSSASRDGSDCRVVDVAYQIAFGLLAARLRVGSTVGSLGGEFSALELVVLREVGAVAIVTSLVACRFEFVVLGHTVLVHG